MFNSILVGKLIKRTLTESEELIGLTANKVYPLLAKPNTDYPFVVYEREGIDTLYTKDGIAQDEVSVLINVCTDDYEQGLIIANIIRHLFEFHSFEDFSVTEVYFDGIKEFTNNEGGYLQQLRLKFIFN